MRVLGKEITLIEVLIVCAIIGIMLGMLCGCGHKIDNGKIVGKSFSKAHTSTVVTPIMVGKVVTMMPITTRYKDEWSFNVYGKDKDGEWHTEKFPVDKQTWDGYLYGQTIDFAD